MPGKWTPTQRRNFERTMKSRRKAKKGGQLHPIMAIPGEVPPKLLYYDTPSAPRAAKQQRPEDTIASLIVAVAKQLHKEKLSG